MPPKAENPYIPKYIKDVSWYAQNSENHNSTDPLAHHRNKNTSEDNSIPRIGSGINDDFISVDNGKPKPVLNKRLKKGRCKNCGGDHDKTDCMEVPRRKGDGSLNNGSDKFKGKRNEDVDYDGKRDRWYGYDANEYNKYITEWEKKKEEEAKLLRENDESERLYDTDEEIELKELGLWEIYSKENIKKAEGEKTVRLIEDKAVYLKDINNDTITYDPKSRAIRDDSTGYFNEKNLFVRHLTGEAKRFEDTKKFAWDETKRGLDQGNIVSNPTLADKKIKVETELEKTKKAQLKKSLLDKYGKLNIGTDGNYNTSSIMEHNVPRSRYVEDIFYGNHTSVWGSYYQAGKWGYKCCKSFDKNDLCR